MGNNYRYFRSDYKPILVIRYNDDIGEYEGFNYNTNSWYAKENPDLIDITENFYEISEDEALDIIEDMKEQILNSSGK